jgi:hypothetical protein
MGTAVSRQAPQRVLNAVGVVLPVHDEEELLPGALQALEIAIKALSLSISCRVAIALDHCGDASYAIARCWGSRFDTLVIRRECKNVGLARRAGAQAILERWPEKDPAQIWLATTDADSRVPSNWLTVQVEAHSSGADLWAGRVRVAEDSATVRRWTERYAAEQDPIHGANLGFSAALYAQLGGFRSLRSGEDRDFHHRALVAGARIAHDLRASVTTSSRRMGRAPGGFARVLDGVEQGDLEATA